MTNPADDLVTRARADAEWATKHMYLCPQNTQTVMGGLAAHVRALADALEAANIDVTRWKNEAERLMAEALCAYPGEIETWMAEVQAAPPGPRPEWREPAKALWFDESGGQKP